MANSNRQGSEPSGAVRDENVVTICVTTET
jgi:hypothetical protein